jgi:hypothetical protein
VTELIQPLAPEVAAPAERDAPATHHAVSFSELVYAHFDWWRNRSGNHHEAAHGRYDRALTAFEARHGRIVGAYWCSHVESGVALTEKMRPFWLGNSVFAFHRESDWATQNSPDVACELHRCDELAVRARTVLTGVRQRICMHLVVASASHLLSLVDAHASHTDDAKTQAALEQERAALNKAEAYYRDAANGQAQMIYFGGMATVALVLSVVAAVWLTLSWAAPVAAMIAGALGAVVSVIQRINNGKFELDYDVGGPYAFFLGGLRPLIGAAFAMAICFAFSGGLLHLPVASDESTDNRRLALMVLGFLAGFSERWAQDTLTAVLPGRQGAAPSPPPSEPGTSSTM